MWGEEFDGVIAAVVPFGFFVELSGVYIEGLVHVSTLSGDFLPSRRRQTPADWRAHGS